MASSYSTTSSPSSSFILLQEEREQQLQHRLVDDIEGQQQQHKEKGQHDTKESNLDDDVNDKAHGSSCGGVSSTAFIKRWCHYGIMCGIITQCLVGIGYAFDTTNRINVNINIGMDGGIVSTAVSNGEAEGKASTGLVPFLSTNLVHPLLKYLQNIDLVLYIILFTIILVALFVPIKHILHHATCLVGGSGGGINEQEEEEQQKSTTTSVITIDCDRSIHNRRLLFICTYFFLGIVIGSYMAWIGFTLFMTTQHSAIMIDSSSSSSATTDDNTSNMKAMVLLRQQHLLQLCLNGMRDVIICLIIVGLVKYSFKKNIETKWNEKRRKCVINVVD